MMRIFILFCLLLWTPVVWAQQASAIPAQGLGFISPNQKEPVQIEADNGLEWRKADNVYIAHGNAKAQSGTMSVQADELRGYYRGGDGKTDFELYKIEAVGNVHITTGENLAQADQAVYDLDQSVFLLLGKRIQLQSPNAQLFASERMEFWQAKNLAVARGHAIALQGENRLMADVISANFMPAAAGQAGGQMQIHTIDAKGHVQIQSKDHLALADNATYNLQKGLATLQGNVKLTQGPNQLNGEYAEMNTKTGVSKILGDPNQSAGAARVRALVIPQPAKKTGAF